MVAQQTEQALQEHKQQAKVLFRRLTSNSEPRLSIESGPYTHQYVSPPVPAILSVDHLRIVP